jgi:thymidine phosphorylase
MLLADYQRESNGKINVTRFSTRSDANAQAAATEGIKPFNRDKGDACYLGLAIAQGAQRESIDDPFGTLPDASVTLDVLAPCAGFVSRVDAGIVGEVVVSLGGGRKKKEDRINPTVGVMVHRMVGDEVDAGVPIATVCAAFQPAAQTAADAIAHAIEISESRVEPRPIVMKTL